MRLLVTDHHLVDHLALVSKALVSSVVSNPKGSTQSRVRKQVRTENPFATAHLSMQTLAPWLACTPVTKVPVTSVVTKETPHRAWACGSHQWVLVSKTVVSNVVSKESPAAHAPAIPRLRSRDRSHRWQVEAAQSTARCSW